MSLETHSMRAAIRLAARGIGRTHPNPRVGAVVLRDGAIVAGGYHARAGEAHAEVRALERAGPAARGATLVTTLEPCAHEGRTPPCVDAVLRAGIRRVVAGMLDPNPLVNGRGLSLLRQSGVEVATGVLEDECRALNPAYLKWIDSGLPWVALKSMVTLDGRLATDSGESRGLGGDEEQRLVHRLRARSDAVIVGVGTVLADDPLLTVRLARGRTPRRVVLDSRLRTPLSARILETAREGPVVLATTRSGRDGGRDAAAAGAYEARGAVVWSFPADEAGRVPLEALLRRLAEEGDLAVLVEGGSSVHTSFLRAGLADEAHVGIAPLVLGGSRAPSWTGDLGRTRVADAIAVDSLSARRVGRDLWLSGRIRRERQGANGRV